VIPNGVGKGNLTINGDTTLANNSTLDLNGNNIETVNGLSSSGEATRAIVLNSVASTVGTLRVGDNNATANFGGIIQNGTGTVALTKIGTGTQTLSGVNTYTGTTTIGAGTLALGVTGSISGSTVIDVQTGAVFDVSAVTNYALASGQTLKGSGSVTGGVSDATGSTISPGSSGAGELTINGNATFSGGTLALEILGTGSSADKLSVNGSVSLASNSPITITLGAFDPVDGVDTFVILANDGADPINTVGRFTFGGTPLNEGQLFTVGTQQFQISYAGGTGNDVVLAAVPETREFIALLGGAGLLALRRRRNGLAMP
jgi:autotransporter-associated beta strand protein